MGVGPDHASDNSIIAFAITLFCTLKKIPLKGLIINCSYRQTGLRECQPDISYYIGERVQLAPQGSSIADLDASAPPDLAPAEGITVLFPNEHQQVSDQEQDKTTRIEPNQTLLIPNPDKDEFELVALEPGMGEVLVIASQKPLTNALLRLNSLFKSRGQSRGLLETRGDESVDVVSDLIDDLSGTKRGPIAGVRQRISTVQIAALSITFEVVKKT